MPEPWSAIAVNKRRVLASLTISAGLVCAAVTFIGKLQAGDNGQSDHFKFQPESPVLSRSVYVGTASTVTVGETLPSGCPGGANGKRGGPCRGTHPHLPGFPSTAASTSTAFPFGIWFANDTTLYVCDEGDDVLVSPAVNGNLAEAQSLATAGVQKWSLVNGTWTMLYVLQDGLNIGVPYGRRKLSGLTESRNRQLPEHDGPQQRRSPLALMVEVIA